MTNKIEMLILNKLNSIENNVVSIKNDVQELKVWAKGIDEWKDDMTEWAKGIDEWKDDMTEWKDSMTEWAKGIDDWKDGIDSWQDTIEGKLDRLMPLCDWSTRFEDEVMDKLKMLIDADTVREQKLEEHTRLLEKHQRILDFHSLRLA